jgi:hypothetical protein
MHDQAAVVMKRNFCHDVLADLALSEEGDEYISRQAWAFLIMELHQLPEYGIRSQHFNA